MASAAIRAASGEPILPNAEGATQDWMFAGQHALQEHGAQAQKLAFVGASQDVMAGTDPVFQKYDRMSQDANVPPELRQKAADYAASMKANAADFLQKVGAPEIAPGEKNDPLAQSISDLHDQASGLRAKISAIQDQGGVAGDEQDALQSTEDQLHAQTQQMLARVPPNMQARIAKAVAPEVDWNDASQANAADPARHFATAEIGRSLRDQVIPPERQRAIRQLARARGVNPDIAMHIADQALGAKAVKDLSYVLRGRSIDPASAETLKNQGLIHQADPKDPTSLQMTSDALPLMPKTIQEKVAMKPEVFRYAHVAKTPADALNLLSQGGMQRMADTARSLLPRPAEPFPGEGPDPAAPVRPGAPTPAPAPRMTPAQRDAMAEAHKASAPQVFADAKAQVRQWADRFGKLFAGFDVSDHSDNSGGLSYDRASNRMKVSWNEVANSAGIAYSKAKTSGASEPEARAAAQRKVSSVLDEELRHVADAKANGDAATRGLWNALPPEIQEATRRAYSRNNPGETTHLTPEQLGYEFKRILSQHAETGDVTELTDVTRKAAVEAAQNGKTGWVRAIIDHIGRMVDWLRGSAGGEAMRQLAALRTELARIVSAAPESGGNQHGSAGALDEYEQGASGKAAASSKQDLLGSPQTPGEPEPEPERIGRMWQDIAKNEDAFQFGPTPRSTHLPDILRELGGEHGAALKVTEDRDPRTGEVVQYVITDSAGGNTYVDLAEPDRPYINSQYTKADGTLIYQAVYAWAHNEGLQLQGDPAGLSHLAELRRTSQMLSSALRFGTTRHLLPHDQQAGLADWRHEDTPQATRHNIGLLAREEARVVKSRLTGLGNYDYRDGAFYEGERRLPNDPRERDRALDRGIAGVDPAFAKGAGHATLGRALVTAAAEKAGKSPVGVLQADPASLKGVLYSSPASNAGEHGIHPLDNLSEPGGMTSNEREQRRQWIADVKANPDKWVQEYSRRFGNVINADNARELFEPFHNGNKATRGRLTDATSGVGQYIAQKAFERAIKEAPKGSRVLFTAGGPGAGKSTAISGNRARVIFDSTFSNYEKSRAMIQQALNAGDKVRVAYVHRPIREAVQNIVNRAAADGRVAEVGGSAERHIQALNNVRKIAAEFGDKIRVLPYENAGNQFRAMSPGEFVEAAHPPIDQARASAYDELHEHFRQNAGNPDFTPELLGLLGAGTERDAGRSSGRDPQSTDARQRQEGAGEGGSGGQGEIRSSPVNPDDGREADSARIPREPSPVEKARDEIGANLVERPRRILQARLEGRSPEEIGAVSGFTPEKAAEASGKVAMHMRNMLRRRGFGEAEIQDALAPGSLRSDAASRDARTGLGDYLSKRTPIIPGIEHPLDVADREAWNASNRAQPAREPSPVEKARDEIGANLIEKPRRILQAHLEGRSPEEIGAVSGFTPEKAAEASRKVAMHVGNLLRRRGFGEWEINETLKPRPRGLDEAPWNVIVPGKELHEGLKEAGNSPIMASSPTPEDRERAFPVLEGRSDQARSRGRYAPESHLYTKYSEHSEKSFVTAERQRKIGNFVDNIWKASGLTNAEKHAQLKAALAVRNPRDVESLVNSDLGFPSKAALSSAKQAMQEMLNMLPRKIADSMRSFHLQFDPSGDGYYKSSINVLCLSGSKLNEASWLPHVWHEFAHVIHVHAPDAYKATLARHFRVRTQWDPIVPVDKGGALGKEDSWLPLREDPRFVYAGRVYREEAIGAGLELPSEYMSYMQEGEGAALALEKDRETTLKVLSIFLWGRKLK